MMRHVRQFAVAALLSGVMAGSAAAQGMDKKMEMGTLYSRLGGKAAITAVVDEFVGRVAGDKRINAFFAATAGDPGGLPPCERPGPGLSANRRPADTSRAWEPAEPRGQLPRWNPI